jgi:hypothetical protein
MAKKFLRFDAADHMHFSLAGIICAHKDYRICYEINSRLGLDFKKAADLELNLEKKHSTAFFSIFQYFNTDEEEFYLLSNKGNNALFIPEQKHIDYYFLLRNITPFTEFQKLMAQLKEITLISSVISIDPSSLKSADHFLYIEPDRTLADF